MQKTLPEEKVTIQAAARTLGVSKGTVVHFLNNGKLTRIKEGSAVFVSMDEIETLL
jgi:excisionase family DNA binding protein